VEALDIAARLPMGARSSCRRPGFTTEAGLRLSRALGMSERFWINVQADYDVELAHDLHGDELKRVQVLIG
jgi:plasmid maintenance system antidote protein VapI